MKVKFTAEIIGDMGPLPSSIIKNPKWLDEQISYLKRKEYSITCYATRAGLGLRNSSNPVEKANDILVPRGRNITECHGQNMEAVLWQP